MKEKILHNMEKSGNHYAIVCAHQAILYKELKEMVLERKSWYENYFANQIVGIVAGNILEVVILLLLALLTKGKIILLGDNLKKNEFEYYLEHLGVQAVFINEEKRKEFQPELESANRFGSIGELECYIYSRDNLAEAQYKYDDYIIQITSGSEGVSKAAGRTEISLENEIINTCRAVDFQNDQVFMTIPPIAHSYGLVIGLLLPLYLGKTVILVNDFVPDLVEKFLVEYKVNVLIAVPFMYHILSKRLNVKTKEQNYLSKCFSAGGFLDDTVRKRFQEAIGITIWNDYGSTETGVMCIETEGISGSVGKPIPGITVSILDSDGAPVKENQNGIVYVSGKSIGHGYVFPAELNESRYCGNIYCTGDIGRFDLHGRIYLEGRNDDFFIVGGEKTSAMEIRKIILCIEGVKDAVVVSENNPVIGDIISVYIVRKPDSTIKENDVLKYCNANMEMFKVPKKVFFIKEIPKSKNGKVLKKYLLNY